MSIAYKVVIIVTAMYGLFKIVISPNDNNLIEIGHLKESVTSQKSEILEIKTELANDTTDIKLIQKDIGNIQDDVKNIQDDVESISDNINELAKLNNSTTDNGIVMGTIVVDFIPQYQPKMHLVNNEIVLSEPKWIGKPGNTIIAVGRKDKNYQYPIESIKDMPFLTMYIEGENEVYFYGSYNEKNHWNGECILNVYNKNQLITIFDGEYEDGVLISYKRVSCEEGNEWKVAIRECKKDDNGNAYTNGETWDYKKTKSFIQKINSNDLDASYILTVDNFLKDFDEELITYYNGRTSNGYYNDDTGNAFIIKYFGDGEIEGAEGKVIHTLYEGRFSNGYFEDETDESWYITREINTKYMYYEGSFSGKTADNNKVEEFTNPIGRNYLVQKLKEKGFEEYESEFYIDYE